MVKNDPTHYPLRGEPVRQPNRTHTETGWEVYEQGLTDTLTWFKQRYGDIPLYITENGSAFYDPPVAEGDVVDDPLRTDYLRRHLQGAARGDRGRRQRQGLLRLVADGQPGMVAGIRQALRPVPRGLRHPEAHAQGQRETSTPA